MGWYAVWSTALGGRTLPAACTSASWIFVYCLLAIAHPLLAFLPGFPIYQDGVYFPRPVYSAD